MDNNQRLKSIYTALKLNDKDVARAASLGGFPTTRNRAKSWLRSKHAKRLHAGSTQKRFIEISQNEFDAFILGLGKMLDEHEHEHEE